MAEDESSCFELDCCPQGMDVSDILTSEALLTEAFATLLTEDDEALFS
jgi:hypothetical protein